ncbi:transmembrane and TPR repeat-containing protein 1-like [Tropilaelaps mercedesae]|uniref:dolichyl-phosphate-mannose--protein mannosyltransferase n=1 Tax=Tropilaelaps mercedesae TaxID=418985 RepID=A0A1V9X999_9ACAR|nr:transmembrane and TPR repeat-containing protein 1-like [Tropilaelaps mercedesae]
MQSHRRVDLIDATSPFVRSRLNYLYSGLSTTRSYHVVNVLLNWICCILLGELAGRLLSGASDRTARTGRGERATTPSGAEVTGGRRNGLQLGQTSAAMDKASRETLALRIAVILIFGVQPVHSEAVASIVGRADLLCGVFYLLALLTFMASCDDDEALLASTRRDPLVVGDEVPTLTQHDMDGTPSRWPVRPAEVQRMVQTGRLKLWLSVTLAVCALLSKEHGLTVLGVLILYRLKILCQRTDALYCFSRGSARLPVVFSSYSRISRLTQWFTTDEHLRLTSSALVGLMAFRIAILGGSLPRFSEHDNPAAHHPHLLTRVLTYGHLAAMNVGILLWPRILSYDWQMGSVPLVHSLFDVRNVFTLALVLTVVELLRCIVHADFGTLLVGSASTVKEGLDAHGPTHQQAADPRRGSRNEGRDESDVTAGVRSNGGPMLLVSAALVILPWLPASNLLVTVGFVLAERVLYIPSMGFCLLVVEGLRRLLVLLRGDGGASSGMFPSGSGAAGWNRRQKVALLSVLILVALGAARTIRRNRVWMNREALFESGVRDLPSNCKMHYNYANLMRDLRYNKRAAIHYSKAVEQCPTHASAHNNLGTVVESPSEAEKHFRRAITINLYHAGAHYNLAMIYRRRGQMEVARGLLERSLALDASLAEAASSLAELESQQGRASEAESLHRRAIELNARSAPIRNNYATFLHHQGRVLEASKQFKEAIALEPDNTVAVRNAAEVMRELSVDDEAEHLYKRALSLNADDVTVMDQLAVLYYKTGRLHEAEELFTRIQNTRPHHRESRLHYAQMLLSQGDATAAERVLAETLEKTGESWRDGLRQLALLYSYTNRSAEAAVWIRKALQLCPREGARECAILHADYGDILKDLSHLNRSAECYTEAIKLQPDLAHAHINLGVIRHLQGDYPSAFHHYTIAYTLEPTNALVVENMEKLRKRILKSFRQHRTVIDAAFEMS